MQGRRRSDRGPILHRRPFPKNSGFAVPGDVLLSHKASIGFVALVPPDLAGLMLTPQVTYYRIFNKDTLDPAYLAQFFRSPRFQHALENVAKQSTRDYIGILAQQRLYIAYPTRPGEQQYITSILGRQDLSIIDLNTLLNKLRSVKAALMQDLLTGRTRVTALLEAAAWGARRCMPASDENRAGDKAR